MSEDKEYLLIESAFETFTRSFSPARSEEDSSRRYTSTQIAAAIHELTGVEVDVKVLYEMLMKAGFFHFIDETTMNLKFIWFLKYR